MDISSVIQDMLSEWGTSFTQHFNEVSGRTSFGTFIAMHNGHIRSFVDVTENTREVFFYAYSPVLIPAGIRESVAAFLYEENTKIKFGRYYINPENGEVHFTSGFIYDEELLPSVFMLMRNFSFALTAMDIMIQEIMLHAAPKPPASTKELIPFWYN